MKKSAVFLILLVVIILVAAFYYLSPSKSTDKNMLTKDEAIQLVFDYIKKDGPLTYGYELVPVAHQTDTGWDITFTPGPNGTYIVNNQTRAVVFTPQQETTVPENTNSAPKDSIKIKITSPSSGSVWKMASAQKISWELSGVNQPDQFVYGFLTGTGASANEGGSIFVKEAKNGADSESYKVAIINVGGDALTSLKPGTYKIVLRIYRSQPGGMTLGYGQLVAEKEGGTVVVK